MTRVVRREIRKRGFFGTIFKILFIVFNLLMLALLAVHWTQVGHFFDKLDSGAGRAGAIIGATFASGLILFVWVAGDVILGLLTLITRGSKTIVEEYIPREPRF